MAPRKLPRRTMSMAKRANATAEEAAELDLVEDAIGTEEDNAERFTTVHLALGMLGAVVVLLVGIVAFVTLTGGSDANYSMLPEGYRESVGLTTAYEGNGRSALSSAPRSPFPSAQQEAPIILEVDCPADTVHIATGANVADTLCVRGVLVEDDASTPTPEKSETIRLIVVPPTATPTSRASTIGGTTVPDDLDCEEDEGIAFRGVPDTLFCVHIEPER